MKKKADAYTKLIKNNEKNLENCNNTIVNNKKSIETYNKLVKRMQKAEQFFEDERITVKEKLKMTANYEDLIKSANFFINMIEKEIGRRLTEKEILEGIDDEK